MGWDDDDRVVYTTGACYDLAVAIHEVTGWPIYGQCWQPEEDAWNGESVGPVPCDECGDGVGADHVVVMTPRGSIIDILGEREPWMQDDSGRGEDAAVFRCHPDDVRQWCWVEDEGEFENWFSQERTQVLAEGLVAGWREVHTGL